MELTINPEDLKPLVDQLMATYGYIPADETVGKTIGMDEFRKNTAAEKPQSGSALTFWTATRKPTGKMAAGALTRTEQKAAERQSFLNAKLPLGWTITRKRLTGMRS